MHTPETVDAIGRALYAQGLYMTAAVISDHGRAALIEIAWRAREDGPRWESPRSRPFKASELDPERCRCEINGDGSPVRGKMAADMTRAVAAAFASLVPVNVDAHAA